MKAKELITIAYKQQIANIAARGNIQIDEAESFMNRFESESHIDISMDRIIVEYGIEDKDIKSKLETDIQDGYWVCFYVYSFYYDCFEWYSDKIEAFRRYREIQKDTSPIGSKMLISTKQGIIVHN